MADDNLEDRVEELEQKAESLDQKVEQLDERLTPVEGFVESFKSAIGHLVGYFWKGKRGGDDSKK